MEAYHAFINKVVEAFDRAGLEYAFTGALAISFYGVPRTTSDIDVIVTVTDESDVKVKLTVALREIGVVFDERKIDLALKSGFKIATFKDKASPYCIDVILTGEVLDKRAGKILGLNTFFQSPEGLIAAKLRMIKATFPPERSAKDKRDIKAITRFTHVDLEAVEKQAKKDGTLQIYKAITSKCP